MEKCQCMSPQKTCSTASQGDPVPSQEACKTAKHRGICRCTDCKCHEKQEGTEK